jgi:hypothetical protein
MKNKDDLVYVALIAFFVGCLTDYFTRADTQINIPADTVKFALDALTALGTVAAVIVALWLGLKSSRDTRHHERVRGRMACSLLHMQVQRAFVDLWGIVALLARYKDEELGQTEFLSRPEFAEMDSPLYGEITVDTLATVAGISDQAAIDLGLGVSKLRVAVRWRDGHRAYSWKLYDEGTRRMIAAVLRTHLEQASRSFADAAAEMHRCARSDLQRLNDRLNSAITAKAQAAKT